MENVLRVSELLRLWGKRMNLMNGATKTEQICPIYRVEICHCSVRFCALHIGTALV